MVSRLIQPLEARSLRHTLNTVFALTFAIPALIFFYNAMRFALMDETIVMLSFAGILAFALFGFIIMRRTTDRIAALSRVAEHTISDPERESASGCNELRTITETFQKLISRLEENTVELGRRVAEIASLKELTDISTKAIDFRLLSGVVTEKLMVTTDAESGVMFSAADDGKTLTVETVRGIDGCCISHETIDTGSTAFGAALRGNGPLMGADLSGEPGFNPPVDGVFSGPFIAKSITARGKTIGVLGLFRGKSKKAFGDPDRDYILTALGQIAFAFDNAELIRELKQSCDKLKAAQEKLIELERVTAIQETAVTISDRINNPLTVIKGHAELIRRTHPDLDPDIMVSLDSILKSCASCIAVMRKLHAIEKPVSIEYAGSGTRMIDVDSSEPSPAEDGNSPSA